MPDPPEPPQQFVLTAGPMCAGQREDQKISDFSRLDYPGRSKDAVFWDNGGR